MNQRMLTMLSSVRGMSLVLFSFTFAMAVLGMTSTNSAAQSRKYSCPRPGKSKTYYAAPAITIWSISAGIHQPFFLGGGKQKDKYYKNAISPGFAIQLNAEHKLAEKTGASAFIAYYLENQGLRFNYKDAMYQRSTVAVSALEIGLLGDLHATDNLKFSLGGTVVYSFSNGQALATGHHNITGGDGSNIAAYKVDWKNANDVNASFYGAIVFRTAYSFKPRLSAVAQFRYCFSNPYGLDGDINIQLQDGSKEQYKASLAGSIVTASLMVQYRISK